MCTLRVVRYIVCSCHLSCLYGVSGDDDLASLATAAVDSDDRLVLGRLLDALCKPNAKPGSGHASVAPTPLQVRAAMHGVQLGVKGRRE